MSISMRNAPVSPISVGANDYFPRKGEEGPYPNNRGNLASPPISGGSPNAIMSMNGFPVGPGSNGGGPSPPPSVGRSSVGTNAFKRDSTRSTRAADIDEGILQEHYFAFRAFLQARDPNQVRQPNKARDKLLRLSAVQFYELSTDVYDELLRRQAGARAPPKAPNAPPTYLLPQDNFHPKRNQARQRLSSLGPPRFRDLAADVFHELERRFPRFVGENVPRMGSSMSMRGPPNRMGPPGPGGYPPRGQSRMRRPSDASSMRGPPPIDAYGIPPSPGLPPGEYGRPMPRQLNQNNTIVPNKSTMVEEDGDGGDDEGDAFGLEGIANRNGIEGSEADKKIIDDYQNQVRELREKLDMMEDALRKKEDEGSRNSVGSDEKQEWDTIRADLEDKLSEAQILNESMKQELQRVRQGHEDETRSLRDEVDNLRLNGGGNADANLQRENEDLRHSLREQQETTEQVRHEAQEFLSEMRVLSQESSRTYEKQLVLEKTVEQLEQEVRDWRNRYARTKTQLRTMRTSTLGLPTEQNASKLAKAFTSETGMIKDIHVTKFQIAIDDLLQNAHRDGPDRVMDSMKLVVVAIRRITKDIDASNPAGQDPAQQKAKLKGRLSSTANNLITASKNFAHGAGLSPVSIVDAAASNLSAAVVELLRSVKIRPTPADELEEEEAGSLTPVDSSGMLSPNNAVQAPNYRDNLPPPPAFQGLGAMRASADSSAYSPVSSPRESLYPASNGATNAHGATNGYGGYANGHSNGTNGYGAHDDDPIDPSDPSYWE